MLLSLGCAPSRVGWGPVAGQGMTVLKNKSKVFYRRNGGSQQAAPTRGLMGPKVTLEHPHSQQLMVWTPGVGIKKGQKPRPPGNGTGRSPP